MRRRKRTPAEPKPSPARGQAEKLESPEPQPLESQSDAPIATESAPDESLLEAQPEEATVALEQHQRLLAEFDNFRKRIERDQARHALWTRAELLKALLPTLDDLDRARAALEPGQKTFDTQGMLIIMDRLAEVLEREGLSLVEAAPGDDFEPEIHEAVLTIPSDEFPEGCVAEVLEKGYRVGDRLLRPAKVAVTRPPDEKPDKPNG